MGEPPTSRHQTNNTLTCSDQCKSCGFLPTQEILEHDQSICMLPGDQCIQCSEFCVQKEKCDAKDFQLAKLFFNN